MLVSILVPTYKDLTALKLIIQALTQQTYKNFEMIIAEDDNSIEVANYVSSLDVPFNIIHITQEDIGNRKATVLNMGIKKAKGEYLIFIDGDTIPFSTFIDAHIKLSEQKTILCGRRVNLGKNVSNDIRTNNVKVKILEENYLKKFSYLCKEDSRHYEQGLYFRPNSILQNTISYFDTNLHVLGSNFSCFTEDMLAINGFDQDIIGCSKDDVDIEWRFLKSGCQIKSCKFSANLFHLDHNRVDRTNDEKLARIMMEKNSLENRYIASSGIYKKSNLPILPKYQINVISINYNSSDHTINMVNSIKEKTDEDISYQIIIIDNASTPKEQGKLSILNNDPRVKIIYNRINSGFAAGNMLGVLYSDAQYYFFLNNDTILKNDVLSILYNQANLNAKVGLLTAQLIDKENNNTTSFKKFPNIANRLFGNALVRFFSKSDLPSNKATLSQPTDVGVISGSCMFFRSEVFNQLGGFDTNFFLYCEEEDISQRTWEAGYKVVIVPKARLQHLEGASTNRNIAIEKEYYISYYLLLRKHFNPVSVSIFKVLTTFKLFRRPFRSKHYFKLFLFLLRGAPLKSSLRYKQHIQKIHKEKEINNA